MNFTRRTFVRLSLGSAFSMTAERLLAQGVSTHTAKPLPRQAPSGRPFNAHFVDVASAAGLHAPTIYGGVERKKYILEATGCGCAFLDYDLYKSIGYYISRRRLDSCLKQVIKIKVSYCNMLVVQVIVKQLVK